MKSRFAKISGGRGPWIGGAVFPLLRDIGRVNNWINLFPTEVAQSQGFAVIDLNPLDDLEASRTAVEILTVLSTLAHAKLMGGEDATGSRPAPCRGWRWGWGRRIPRYCSGR